MSPFTYNDYKKYLAAVVKKSDTRGIKAILADAAGCQRSFFSQVLNGSVHLTLEHSLGIANYLRLNPLEIEYFYCLVASARSGSKTLSKFYVEKMELLKKKSDDLSQRMSVQNSQTDFAQIAEYYSSWKFAAVYVACTIPTLRTPASIAKKFHLDAAEVERIFAKMISWGLIEERGSQYHPCKDLHLTRDHFMNMTNHRNWRLKNLELADNRPDRGINYSALYSLSLGDFEKLKEMTIEFLNASRSLVQESAEEELVSFNIDCVLF